MAAIEAASASWFGKSDALPALGSGGTYPHRDLTLAGLQDQLDQLSMFRLKVATMPYVWDSFDCTDGKQLKV